MSGKLRKSLGQETLVLLYMYVLPFSASAQFVSRLQWRLLKPKHPYSMSKLSKLPQTWIVPT